jgi:hypothetical protein
MDLCVIDIEGILVPVCLRQMAWTHKIARRLVLSFVLSRHLRKLSSCWVCSAIFTDISESAVLSFNLVQARILITVTTFYDCKHICSTSLVRQLRLPGCDQPFLRYSVLYQALASFEGF